jgi:hypothetical protein
MYRACGIYCFFSYLSIAKNGSPDPQRLHILILSGFPMGSQKGLYRIIIGLTGCSKTECWKSLLEAVKEQGEEALWEQVNPKAVTSDELYGIYRAPFGVP